MVYLPVAYVTVRLRNELCGKGNNTSNTDMLHNDKFHQLCFIKLKVSFSHLCVEKDGSFKST